MSTEPFADRLRSAADAVSPSFSPDLHATVMRQLRRERAAEPKRPRQRSTAARWAVAAVAAIVALGIGIRGMWPTAPSPRPVQPEPVAMSLPSFPSWSDAVGTVSRPIARQLADARVDLVDRSAGRFARYCVDQLDVFPAPARGVSPTTSAARDVDRG